MPENWETFTKKQLVPIVTILNKNFEQSLTQINREIATGNSYKALLEAKRKEFDELKLSFNEVTKLIQNKNVEHETNRLLMEKFLRVCEDVCVKYLSH
jgi:hypothetical protein